MTAPKRYNRMIFTAAGALLLAAFGISLLIGAYPLTAQDILSALSGGEGMAVKVFSNVVVVVLNYVFSKLIVFKRK